MLKNSSILILFLIGLLTTVYILGIPSRKPHIDDAWLAEHSYWFLHDGLAKSKLMSGIADGENRLILHHKLFTIQGAAIVALFGFSLQAFKFVSLLYLLFTAMLIYLSRLNKSLFYNKNTWKSALLVLFLSPLIYQYSFVYRPETMLMFIGFFSFLSLSYALKSNRPKMFSWIGGLLAGLSLATHLNGSIFIAAGFLLLISRWKPKLAILFAIGAITTTLGYFYDFRSFSDFYIWYTQLTFIPSTKQTEDGFFMHFILNILNEHLRYFHSPKEISLTLLLITALITTWKYIRLNHSVVFHYMILLVLSLGVISLHKTSKYLVLLLPYFSLLIAYALDENFWNNPSFKRPWLAGALIIYLIVGMVYNVSISTRKYDAGLNRKISEVACGDDCISINALAPMIFIFDEITHYQKITSLMSINERLKIDPELKDKKLLETLSAEGIDILYLNHHYQQKLLLSSFSLNDTLSDYKAIYKANDLMIWKKKNLVVKADEEIPKIQTSYKKGIWHYVSAFD